MSGQCRQSANAGMMSTTRTSPVNNGHGDEAADGGLTARRAVWQAAAVRRMGRLHCGWRIATCNRRRQQNRGRQQGAEGVESGLRQCGGRRRRIVIGKVHHAWVSAIMMVAVWHRVLLHSSTGGAVIVMMMVVIMIMRVVGNASERCSGMRRARWMFLRRVERGRRRRPMEMCRHRQPLQH